MVKASGGSWVSKTVLILIVPGILIVTPFLLWAWNLIHFESATYCSFDSVSKGEYEKILMRARGQRFSVWPGLSNGLIRPSNRVLGRPTSSFDADVNNELLRHVREAAGGDQPAEGSRQLAAAHAVMSGIGSDYVQVLRIPGNGSHSSVYFRYYVPQVRFAPLCFPCLIWWYTTISVSFSHDQTSDRYELRNINLLHAQFKYNPDKDAARNVAKGECPSFPKVY